MISPIYSEKNSNTNYEDFMKIMLYGFSERHEDNKIEPHILENDSTLPTISTGILTTTDSFFQSGLDENSTSYDRPIIIDSQFNSLINNIDKLDDDNNFEINQQIGNWIENYGRFSIEVIYAYISSQSSDDDVSIELLKATGNVRSNWSNESRKWLLNHFLSDERPKIRYGAISGIANSDDQIFIEILEKHLSLETNKTIKMVIQSTLMQLENKEFTELI